MSQHGQLVAIPPPFFSEHFPLAEHAKWRCDTPPSQKGHLSDTCAIPNENKAIGRNTPLCDTISKGYCAIWVGISHWASKFKAPVRDVSHKSENCSIFFQQYSFEMLKHFESPFWREFVTIFGILWLIREVRHYSREVRHCFHFEKEVLRHCELLRRSRGFRMILTRTAFPVLPCFPMEPFYEISLGVLGGRIGNSQPLMAHNCDE